MGLFDSSDTTSVVNPIADLQASYLPGIYGAATDLYNQGAQGYYPGSTVAAFDPVRAQGVNLGVDAALGSQQQLAQGQTGLLGNILTGNDAYSNQLAQQAAAGVANSFGQAGTLGSARNYQQANLAASDAILGRQLDASQQVGQAQTNALTPSTTLSNIGKGTQQYQQDILNADKTRYDFQADQPWNHLSRYQDVITSPNSQQYQQSSTQSSSPSTFSTLAGIGSTIAGLFAEGGEVGGRRNPNGIPEGPMTREIAQGAYAPVETQRTNYQGSNWQRPGSSHGWAIVDGRYQYVPSAQGSQVGGFGNGNNNTNNYNPGNITKPVTNTGGLLNGGSTGGGGSGDGPGFRTPTFDAAGNPAPYLGEDRYDREGDDNFLTQSEIASRIGIVSNVLGSEYNPRNVLTQEQRDKVNNSQAARLAMDDIYNNQQAIYGSQTGNNRTSLSTGGLTDTSFLSDLGNVAGTFSPTFKNLLPEYGDTSFGNGNYTEAQFNSQGDKWAREAGSTKNADGTYDISSWYGNDGYKPRTINEDKGLNGFISGGGADGIGNFGTVGDVLGGIGDGLGLTNYSGQNSNNSGDYVSPGQDPGLVNRYFGTGKWEPFHPTDVTHNQQYSSDNPGQGNPLAGGLGTDQNYDRFGNRRTEIPAGIESGNTYWNSTTGAWTDKTTGIPVGGSIVDREAEAAAEAAANAKAASEAKAIADAQAAAKAAADAKAAAAQAVLDAAEAARRRDRQSAGSKALADSTRAQLSSGIGGGYNSNTGKTSNPHTYNQGGMVNKLDSWNNFKNRYGV